MEPKVPDLYEFLAEAELQQYYNSLKNELKITNVTHLKYATDEDLRQVSGLSRPEIRRLRKYYEKYYPHGYLNKIRRLLQPPRKDENNANNPASSIEPIKSCPSPGKIPNNKHIIPPDAICVNKQLGTGEFGIVQQGVWTNGSERIQVAIKCLCRERMQSNPMEFLKEAAMMHSIEHENIVRLYGVVLDTESLMLVTELAHLRSLLECLKDPGLRVSFLTVPTLCEFSSQICNGMMYLENKRFIHRDLAARNILVFSKNKVKISDFGLSRALGVGKDYYQTNFNVNLKLPIAWCAPECINFLRFTHASDVWAYGVCLWEIFSYGFQPWAALTGHQILEAIDEPHYQRLEKPECCPKEYYGLMLKCWQHDAAKRPKFSEIFLLLPDMKPEQLKTIVAFSEPKKDYLMYRQGEIVTVLDKNNNSPYWKGVLTSGKTGLFNPANTVAYLDSLPSSVNRDSFCRTVERSSKRKIRTDMISRPQNDLKHTGHVGIDGVSFGDVAFLSSPQNLPRQIVTPYKPSEDLEQTPLLLPPTPTSPDSIQTASGYFSETLQLAAHQSFINAGESHHHGNIIIDHSNNTCTVDGGMTVNAFDFRNSGFKDSNPFINAEDPGETAAAYNNDIGGTAAANAAAKSDGQNQHEYHEISDDDMVTEKVFDQGPSLMDEMEHVFKSMSTISEQAVPVSPDAENTNMRNELTELTTKLSRKNSSSTSSGTIGNKSGSKSKSKKTSTVKPISGKDEKLLNQVIEMANEISAKSMTDLVSDASQQTSSPKRKFSFRFPHIHNVVGGSEGLRGGSNGGSMVGGNQSHSSGLNLSAGGSSHAGRGSSQDKDHAALSSSSGHAHHPHSSNTLANSYREKRNFSQEVNNVPDLQSTITEEARIAYNSLVENPCSSASGGVVGGGSSGGIGINAVVGGMGSFTSSTLPRAKLTNSLSLATASFRFKDIDCCSPPTEQAPKSPEEAVDLLLDGSGSNDSNPLRMLRSKNFAVVPRSKSGKFNAHPQAQPMAHEEQQMEPESPSYHLSNAEFGAFHSQPDGEVASNNPIPLPPRDRNKTIPVNQKRHVRKYPLIIPATGVQRTLNKVTQVTPIEEKAVHDVFANAVAAVEAGIRPSELEDDVDQQASCNLDVLHKSLESQKLNEIKQDPPAITATAADLPLNVAEQLAAKHGYSKEFLENNFPNLSASELCLGLTQATATTTLPATIPAASAILTRRRTASDASAAGSMQRRQPPPPPPPATLTLVTSARDPTYENLDIFQTHNQFCVDTASLHCESILENDAEAGSPIGDGATTIIGPLAADDTVDGFDRSALFDTTETTSAPPMTTTTAKTTDCGAADLSQQRVDGGELKKSMNFVSCEDLLEFAEKPKGRARGLESDEVRIMSKVLGKKPSPEQCLLTLEFIDWDIHKAIKLCKLQTILGTYNLSLSECREALQTYDWDLHTTALKLKGGGGGGGGRQQ
uniref:non-specific protein-tyrosine kinase n=1 Tax=Anopheles atroparvus TaxID=41427 RepID=A0A182IUJ2_ANOAO